MAEQQTIPLASTPVYMLFDGGTVYDREGNDIGIAKKGTLWFTRYMEWIPRGGEDSTMVGLEDVNGNWTWAFPTELSLPESAHQMRKKRWRYHA